MNIRVACSAIALLASALLACNDGSDGPVRLSRDELIKPEACKGCHRRHYEQWSGSMHAYASKDPVFRAMNARGQRETAAAERGVVEQPELGKFCVNCHAPMAVHEGMTKDGTDLDHVPDYLQGVTCYFCHNVASVEGDHNNMLQLSDDITMRAAVMDPVDSKTHDAAYSALHDGSQLESSPMCGGCHDIVTLSGVHLERTFDEYRKSYISQPVDPSIPDATPPSTCASCHMRAEQDPTFIANAEGVRKNRYFHNHLFPAVDVALTEFPHRDALRSAIEDCEFPQSIANVMFGPDPTNNTPGAYSVSLETTAGHSQPSGASQDRRMWLEIAAYDAAGKKVFETDKFKDDGAEVQAGVNPPRIFHDSIFNAKGEPVHMFWEAAKSDDFPGYKSRALPFGPKPPADPTHSVSVTFALTQEQDQVATRFELKLRMRPMGFDVLQDLVDSRDLDADVLDEVPTFTVYSSTIERAKSGAGRFTDPTLLGYDCDRSRCMIEPLLEDCKKD